MINKIKNKNRGFTLIEMLVAILLLITAVAGPLTIASKGITAATIAKDQVTAFNLAQDAIEYVRFGRDTNKLQGGDWLTGAGASDPAKATDFSVCMDVFGCYVDSTSNAPPVPGDCTGTVCTLSLFRFDTAAQRYTHRSGGANLDTTVIFSRRVFLDTSLGPNEVIVRALVIWCYRGSSALSCYTNPDRNEVEVRENLLNWQQ